jgi:hypothetical protein
MGFWDRFRRSHIETTDAFSDASSLEKADSDAIAPAPLAPSHSIVSVPAGYELIKADQMEPTRIEMPPTGDGVSDPKALYWDPFALIEQLGFRDRPSSVTYATLNAMVWRMPIVQAIVQTRINQVSAFCSPQSSRFETGFRIKMRDREGAPTKSDKKFARQMEDMLMVSGGTSRDPRGTATFESFMRRLVRDSMVYDQMCFEVVPGRDGRPAEWYAVDASTIRLANTDKLYPDDSIERVHSVQVYDNVTIAEFTREEMAFEVRNPRTDIRGYGYGTSELEMLVSTVTAILWAWQYNQNAFAQGSLQKGILNIVGSIPEKQLKAFRRLWYQQVSGVENAWRTPITNAEKLEWINMQNSSKDMEFSAWMDFLIKVTCSVFQMDPIEVNFKYGTQSTKAMFEGGNQAKIIASKDRGLKPLLRFLSRAIDKYIIWPINPDFTLEFVGLESQTPKEIADLFTQRARSMYLIDELRAEQDLPPLPDGMGQVILDANWMNARKEVTARKQQEQAKEEQEAALRNQVAAISSLPESAVSKEELAQLAQMLTGASGTSGAAGVGGAAAPNPLPALVPGAGSGGGPGGGRRAPVAPPKDTVGKSLVIDVEV